MFAIQCNNYSLKQLQKYCSLKNSGLKFKDLNNLQVQAQFSITEITIPHAAHHYVRDHYHWCYVQIHFLAPTIFIQNNWTQKKKQQQDTFLNKLSEISQTCIQTAI